MKNETKLIQISAFELKMDLNVCKADEIEMEYDDHLQIK